MKWMDDANKASRLIKDRERKLVEDQDEFFDSLWEELKSHIEAAKGKGFPGLFTNGTARYRVIGLPIDAPGQSADPKEVRITLSKDDHQIVASGGGVDVVLDIDVRADGVGCLKLDGNELPKREAAIHILWPFLYPELPPYSGPTKPPISTPVTIPTSSKKTGRGRGQW